jgi:hypothetical protein
LDPIHQVKIASSFATLFKAMSMLWAALARQAMSNDMIGLATNAARRATLWHPW